MELRMDSLWIDYCLWGVEFWETGCQRQRFVPMDLLKDRCEVLANIRCACNACVDIERRTVLVFGESSPSDNANA